MVYSEHFSRMATMKVTSEELIQNFDQISDRALSEPVTIMSDGQDRLMLMSEDEYMRLKRRDRQVYRAESPPEAAAFNHEYPSKSGE
jgi:PHD/YefM family antitoxin component YafN of YafNO toxin-antitoxin module